MARFFSLSCLVCTLVFVQCNPQVKQLGDIFKEKNLKCDDSAIDFKINCEGQDNARYPTIDGSCNNCIDPRLGKAFIPLKRLLTANYEDNRLGTTRKSRKVILFFTNDEKILNFVEFTVLLWDTLLFKLPYYNIGR